MKAKIGLIGTGMMGQSHIKALVEHCGDRAEVTALCDGHEPNLKQAQKMVPKARVCSDAEAMFKNGDVDGVIISIPNYLHAQVALAALAAGKHVFAEKPVATTREDCVRMVAAAEKSDRCLMIGHELRFGPLFQKVKELITKGEIGKPQFFWCSEFRPPFLEKVGLWINDRRKSGGALVDKNSHHFDLMCWWAEAHPKTVFGFGGKAFNEVLRSKEEIVDHAAVSWEFANGMRGSLDLCMFAPHTNEDLDMGVIGSEGMLKLYPTASNTRLHLWKRNQKGSDPVVFSIPPGVWGGHFGFTEIHQAFLDAILEKKPSLTDVRNCASGTLLAIAAEEAIRKHCPVEV